MGTTSGNKHYKQMQEGLGLNVPSAKARRIVMVSGRPGSGKTTLATALAPALGFSLVSKDHIKEALFDALAGPVGDLAFSRQIGNAAMAVLWSIAERSCGVVLEANFRPHNEYERARLEALQADLVEIFCDCLHQEAAQRFADRAQRGNHPAHPITELSVDLAKEYDRPMGVGHVLRVSTTGPIEVTALVTAVRDAFAALAKARQSSAT